MPLRIACSMLSGEVPTISVTRYVRLGLVGSLSCIGVAEDGSRSLGSHGFVLGCRECPVRVIVRCRVARSELLHSREAVDVMKIGAPIDHHIAVLDLPDTVALLEDVA